MFFLQSDFAFRGACTTHIVKSLENCNGLFMEGLDPRSPYHHRDNYRDHLSYPEDTYRGPPDRPRPASARDLGYGDMFDSGIHPHSSSPRINQAVYGENPVALGLEGRTGSLDRRGELYGTLRSNFDSVTDRLNKAAARQQYALKSLSSNPGLSSVLGSGSQPHRRAHSYDMNLEKQGLADYNSLLAAAGVGTNPNIYGNVTTNLLDYSGLTAPTLSSLGGLDYASLQRTAFPTLQPGLINLAAASDITTLQRECLRLQHELDVTREKLNACTTSIRTFWSPELKRERSMRKEENAKYAILADHLHQLQLEKQTMLETLHNMEADLRRERDIRIRGRFSTEHGTEHLSELDLTKRQVDQLTLENKQLKKAIEEADRRTANVKASLTATEESLRRLIEAVKAGKGATTGGVLTSETGGTTGTTVAAVTAVDTTGATNIRLERIESDRAEISRLRHQLNEACTRGSEAERQLIDRNYDLSRLKEEFNLLLQDHRQLKQENDTLRQDTRQTQTLQSIVDTKESKIMTLENEIRLLEDEIARLRDDGLITPNTSTSSGIDDLDKTLQAFRSNERLLKSKIEMLNGEISKRDCEIYTLQSRLEMTDKQHQDQTHHINVLKEQVKTREHKISMLTADTEDFRKRLKEKETQLEKKTKTLSNAQTAKRQMETELAELKDQIDIKERKISLLQRKIENLEDLLNDKDTQLAASKARLTRISAERAGAEGVRAAVEETLKEREILSERLKEARGRGESPGLDEIDAQKRIVSELRIRLESVQREADEKATQLLELREELSELRTGRFKHEAEVTQLQAQLNQRASEVATLQMEKQMQHKQISSEYELKYGQRISELENQVTHYMEASSKLQSEVDRLLRNLDNEKFEKEKQMHELQEELREAQNNLSNLKRTQQAERKKQTQLLEEARQREDNAHSDVEILKGIMSEKDSRIRELEQALRESVRLTAEREIYASGRDDETRQLEQQLRELRTNLEQLQRERNNLSAQMATMQEELSDRENQLKTLEQECFQNYLPELEKLRRANHEANLRVAAMVKLTQGREHALTDQDRTALSSIPLFPNIATIGGWSAMGTVAPGSSRLMTGSSGYLGAYHSGGTTSPHLAGSAFQLIGNSATALATASGGRASVPGQPISSPDVIMLTRMLQEKENMVQQHLQELTHLRFQNSELEIRLKATQRELEAKTTRLSILETAQYSALSRIDSGTRSPTGYTSGELAQLRKANQELSVKFAQLQMDLDDRERQLRAIDRLQSTSRTGTDFSELSVLRRELVTVKAEKETEIMNLNSQLDSLKQERGEISEKLKEVTNTLSEKSNQLRLSEAEKDKEITERESIQKKYEVVLTQLSDKTDKVQKLESDNSRQSEELRRQKTELDDMRHHATYLQNTIQERENRIESVEKDSFKIRDELVNVKKQLSTLETEAKSLREELAYREERLRQIQAQHTEELSRLRSANQEQATRTSHLEMKLDEKEHELKTQSTELRCQADEISRLQNSIEEYTNRLTISQKRVEERELRLKKLENENHDLLDEIHGLRKGNTDLESQVDSLRQRLLDRQDRSGSVGPSAAMSPPIRSHQSTYGSSATAVHQELDRVRKQYQEAKALQEQTQKALEESQIQYDQMSVQRNTLRTQLEQEIAKRAQLEEQLRANDDQWKARVFKAENSEQAKQTTIQLNELRNELERKEAQITCLNKEIERMHTSSTLRDRLPDSTSQQLLLADLQVRLRQVTEERDQAKEQLTAAVSHTEATYLETQQQLLLEKQTLQQQVANLTQTAHNATSEADRYQREARQASSRIQQLSRQLQETQNNCDAIARQRDSLRDQLDQLKRTTGRPGSSALSSVANLFGAGGGTSYGRPASAGPGSYENFGSYGLSGSTSQLSRELDRLHREHELAQQQLRSAQEAEEESRKEIDRLKQEVKQLEQEADEQKAHLRELEEQKRNLESEMVKKEREDTQKSLQQQKELCEKLQWTEQQLNEKTNQLENVSHQLNNTRQYCSELEHNTKELTQRLNVAESRSQSQMSDLQQYQQLQMECNRLRNELQMKDSEIQRLTIQLDQLNREYQNQHRQMEQMTIELSTTQASLNETKQELQKQQQLARDTSRGQFDTDDTGRESDRETIRLLQMEIKDAANIRQRMEQELDELQNELQITRAQLEEKADMLESLEFDQLKQQKEEIQALQRELQAARAQIEELGGPGQLGTNGKGSPLKVEIDSLKREMIKRDDTIARLERECQEKHLRRIESMQAQIRRFEEEAANLNKVLDEQRAGLEERDRLIRQLRSNQGQASTVELEKLRNEHARCKGQIDQQTKRINTMAEQIESQSDEILAIKLEALTASLCEKEANIALMELTAPKNAASNQALDKLRTERDQLQTQQRQLSNTRAMLAEERKTRK